MIAAVAATLVAATAIAEELVPEDECVLELDLPPGTEVELDGQSYGNRQHFLWRDLAADEFREVRLTLTFNDGETFHQRLLLLGGNRVRLPMRSSRSRSPELVIQSGHASAVTAAVFSDEERYAITGAADGTAMLWEVETGRRLRTYSAHSDAVRCVAFGAGGDLAISGSDDNKAILWELATGRPLRILDKHQRPIVAAAIDRRGRAAITGSEDNTAIIWSIATGRPLHVLSGHTLPVQAVAFSPDGQTVTTASRERKIVWASATGRQISMMPSDDPFCSNDIDLTPDGKYRILATWFDLYLLDTANGRRRHRLEGHSDRPRAATFGPSGRLAISGSDDKTAIIWDVEERVAARVLRSLSEQVASVAISNDGRTAIAGSWDHSGTIWDLESGSLTHRLEGHVDIVKSVAISPDSRFALTGSYDNSAIVWDLPTGMEVRRLEGHSSAVTSVAFSPDGRLAVTGSADQQAIVWHVQTGADMVVLDGHTDVIDAVAFDANGRRVLTGSYDQTAAIWDVATGRRLRTFRGDMGTVSSVAACPNGEYVLTADDNRQAVLWDAVSGRETRLLKGHTDWLSCAQFSPDGERLITSSADKTAVLWDVSSGSQLRTFQHGNGVVMSAAVAPDNERVLTGSLDGVLRVWSVSTGQLLLSMKQFRQGWLVTTPEGLFDGNAAGREQVAYRIGDGLNVVPADRFFKDFYYPGLLAAIWRGERPMPEVEIGQSLPPDLSIVSPATGPIADARVDVVAEAVDAGGGVEGPFLYHNGTKVSCDVATDRSGDTLRTTFRGVYLVEGENQLEVRAACADGSWESEPARVTVTYNKPLQKPELHVLAVGLNDYADAGMDLRYAAPDASSIGALFAERGPALYADVHVHRLVDREATRQGIRDAVARIATEARAQDTFIAFLAGHGWMVGQRYYFLPHEFRRTPGREIDTDVRKQGLAADVLAEAITAVPARKRVLVLDTCHAGGAIAPRRRQRDPFAFRGAIERLQRTHGIFTIGAAPAGAKAEEPEALGHGVLTYTLLAGLRAVDHGPLADDYLRPSGRERVADVLSWFNYASGRVPRLMEQFYGEEQDVQMSASGSSFPLLPVESN